MSFHTSDFTFFFNCINNSLFNSSRLYDGGIGVGIVSHSYCKKIWRNTRNQENGLLYATHIMMTSAGFTLLLPDSEQTSSALNFSRFRFPFLGMTTAGVYGHLSRLCALPSFQQRYRKNDKNEGEIKESSSRIFSHHGTDAQGHEHSREISESKGLTRLDAEIMSEKNCPIRRCIFITSSFRKKWSRQIMTSSQLFLF